MNKSMWALAFVAALGFSGCDKDKNALSKGAIRDIWSQASDTQSIRTRGIGAVPQGTLGFTERRGLARNAALVAARYEMLQVIKGLRVTGGLTVGKLMQTHGEIKEVADRIVAGSEEEQVEWAKDDGCVVLLRLDRDKVEKIVNDTAAYESPTGAALGTVEAVERLVGKP